MVVSKEEQSESRSIYFVKSDHRGVEVKKFAADIENPDFAGAVFVWQPEFEEALKAEEDLPELDVRLVILPILLAVVIVAALVLWKYRGF